MHSWIPASPHQVEVLALVMTRLSCLLLATPVMGNRFIPWNVRLILAGLLSVLIAPLWWDDLHVRIDNFAARLTGEALLGLWFALAIVLLLTGIQLSGHLISNISGMTLTESPDTSTGAASPIFATFIEGLVCCIFLLLGGHRLVVRAILNAFSLHPPGTISLTDSAGFPLAEVLMQGFLLGVRIGAPVILLSLATTLIIGVVGRTVPQMNFLTIGTSMNVLVAIGGTALAVGTITWLMQSEAQQVAELMTRIGSTASLRIGNP